MKTEFELQHFEGTELVSKKGTQLSIVGANPKNPPYITLVSEGKKPLFMKDRDLERFAVNILKALKSKKLKQ